MGFHELGPALHHLDFSDPYFWGIAFVLATAVAGVGLFFAGLLERQKEEKLYY